MVHQIACLGWSQHDFRSPRFPRGPERRQGNRGRRTESSFQPDFLTPFEAWCRSRLLVRNAGQLLCFQAGATTMDLT